MIQLQKTSGLFVKYQAQERQDSKEECKMCGGRYLPDTMRYTDIAHKHRMCPVCAFILAVMKYGENIEDAKETVINIDKTYPFSEQNLPRELRKIRREYIKTCQSAIQHNDPSIMANIERKYLGKSIEELQSQRENKIEEVDNQQFIAISNGRRILRTPYDEDGENVIYHDGDVIIIQDDKTKQQITRKIKIANKQPSDTRYTFFGGKGKCWTYLLEA